MAYSFLKLSTLFIISMFMILVDCGNLVQVMDPVNQGNGVAMLKIATASGGPFQRVAKKASLTITASDMLDITKALSVTDTSVEGIITGIPAGKNRLFSVSVYDSVDTLQYWGSSTVNVLADSTVKVTINVIRIIGSAFIKGNIIENNIISGLADYRIMIFKDSVINPTIATPIDTVFLTAQDTAIVLFPIVADTFGNLITYGDFSYTIIDTPSVVKLAVINNRIKISRINSTLKGQNLIRFKYNSILSDTLVAIVD